MTQIGNVYGEAMYTLAREEGLSQMILDQLHTLSDCFRREPDFLQLLGAHSLGKEERCRIVENCFRGRVTPYVLNFLKLLTEKGYIRHYFDCLQRYQQLYYQDHNILPVTAVSAVALTDRQISSLKGKLSKLTGKQIALSIQIDPTVLGGMQLFYGDKCIDGTVSHRLEAVKQLLKSNQKCIAESRKTWN